MIASPKKSFCYSKKLRLSNNQEFIALLKIKPYTKVKNNIFNVHVLANNIDNSRLGMIISKKFCKKAVVRNILKRYIREQFRLTAPYLQNIDILFRLKNNIIITKKSDFMLYKACINNIILLIRQNFIKI